MKKFFVFILLLIGLKGFSQGFPGTDSMRTYNSKYITNNPATAFTNLRLHTLLRGIIDWIDTARAGTGGGGAVGVDSIAALNDSTIRYRKNGTFKTFVLRGKHWTLQHILNNGSTLTENETITLADSLFFASGKIVVENLRVTNASSQTDTALYKPAALDANGDLVKFNQWKTSANLQQVTDNGNKTTDTIIAGFIKLDSLDIVDDTTTYKPAAFDANGNLYKFNRWSGSGSGSDSTIDGHLVTKNFPAFNIDKWQNNHVPTFNIIDSAFYPGFPNDYLLGVPVGSATYIFGNSIISPSVTPTTDSMHGNIVARTVGGTLFNYAVGGTDIRNGLARLTQEWLLPVGGSSLAWWQHGIDRRDDLSDGADSAVVYGARAAGCMAFRDTTIGVADFIFTGTWTDFTGGVAAGGMTEGKVTSTAGDWFQFQITGRFAFFTFFSENINNNATNYSDSITVTVDGVYYGSYSTKNVGITNNKYMGAIVIHNLTNAAHNIQVINQRNLPLAIDFAGALMEPASSRPVLFELVPPVGDAYIGGSGYAKKKVFNRMNFRYAGDVWNTWQRWGFRGIAVDPSDGLDMNQHSLDDLHPNNEGQRLMAQSVLRRLNIYPVNDPSNQWSILGNSGTVAGTNFVGTTDNVSLTLKANGVRRALFGTNDQVALTQFSTATQQGDFAAGSSIANGPFAAALNRSQATNQGAFAAGEPGCLASGYASFATGISQATAARSVGLVNGNAGGDNSVAIGYGVRAKSFGEVVFGVSDDTTGSYLWSASTIVKTDPAFRIGIGEMDGSGNPINRRNAFRLNKNGIGILDTAWYYKDGRVPVATTTADSNMLMARKHVLDLIGGGGTTLDQAIANGNALTTNRTIANSTFQLDITGSRNFADGYTFGVTNTTGTTGIAIKGIAADGRAIWGEVTSGVGVYGNATSGYGVASFATTGNGLYTQSGSGLAIESVIQPSSTNTVVPIYSLSRATEGTAGNGIGQSIDFYTATTTAVRLSNQIISKWTNATDASRTSQFEIWGVDAGTSAQRFTVKGTGQLQGNNYGSGTFTGTPAYSIQTTSSGDFIEGPLVASGTYTPTLTNVTNITASTAYQCQYMRVGNVVTVSGKIDIDPTSTGASELGISLPISSGVPNDYEAAGNSNSGANINLHGAIRADTVNDRAALIFTLDATAPLTNQSWFFSFTYLIDNS